MQGFAGPAHPGRSSRRCAQAWRSWREAVLSGHGSLLFCLVSFATAPRRQGRRQGLGQKHSVNIVKERGDDYSEDEGEEEGIEVLTIADVVGVIREGYMPPKCFVKINDKEVEVWADSCSPYTIINEQMWNELGIVEMFLPEIEPEGYCGGKLT
ncbi:hypothetical protein NDU88_004663 [Pleurodeles waltl]|uniref:Uncharacterized protein n=1 Tax=Pleurodeles waltl TaxID=8319 RepID=A0AAV7W5L6_PLEWA|nr:hypothetical protein NDU88_004663 [Pleurodeles waltl]